MTREVILHSEAEAEVLQALDWYAERSAVAARAFVQELNQVISLAARSPETWPRAYGNTRRIVSLGFRSLLFLGLEGRHWK